MQNKLWGFILMFIGLSFLQAALLSFTNTDYPTKKALIIGGFSLIVSIYPLIKGFKMLRKKAVIDD